MSQLEQDLIGTAEVAALRGVSRATVARMAADGALPYAAKLPGRTGAYLFRRADVDATDTPEPAA